MYTCMLKAHTALGEGPQAVALMKEMRALGLPVAASACSLLVLAFCRAGALQVRPLHLKIGRNQHTCHACVLADVQLDRPTLHLEIGDWQESPHLSCICESC